MLTSVTGRSSGIENKTVSNAIHNTATTLIGHPILGPIDHRAALTSVLRCHMLMTIGMAYVIDSEITPTETNARNAEDEPRLISASSI